MVEFYNVVNKDYINLCKQQVLDVRIKVELLDHYEHTIGEVTTKVSATTGTINVKYNQGVRRTCDITIDDINKKMLPNDENSVFFVNKKFKIYIGLYKKNWSKSGSDGSGIYYNSQDDTIYWFSQGIFITQSCDYDKKNGVLHLSGVDKFGFFTKDLNQHTLQNTYHISADSKLGQLISDIITIDMGNGMPTDTQTPIIHTSFVNQVLPYDIEKTANETIGDILIEIATAFNADIYYDTDGHLVFEPNIIDDYNRQAPVFNFGKNDSALIDMTLDFNYGDIVNQITVTGDNSDGVVYSSTATNENPVSSLRVSNIGIKAADIEETAMGYSDKRCSDYANYLLKKKMRIAIAGTITCTPLPHLDCNRVIKVYQNEEDVNEIDLLIEEVQIPLSPEAYSLSVCNIQDLPLTCYTSMIPQSALSEWIAFRDTDSLGKYINRGGETFVVAPSFVNGRTMTAIGGTGYLDDGDTVSSGKIKGLDNVTTIFIEDGITSIKENAFYNYTSLENVIIPNGVSEISNRVFSNCSSLSNITIPNSVVSIGEYAFYNCVSLENITIPDNVTDIISWAFWGCTNLKGVNISNLSAWCNINFGNYEANPLYYANNLYIDNVLAVNIVIPDNITNIKFCSFLNCTSLESVTIPNSIINIKEGAFRGCTKLSKITIPDSVTSIEDDVFRDCTSLTNVTIPDSVTNMGDDVFNNCTSIINMSIPNSIEFIPNYLFSGCVNLSSVIIPDSITSIGCYVFNGCTNLANIYYMGTEEQWESINKCSYWNSYNMGTNVEGGTVINYNYTP